VSNGALSNGAALPLLAAFFAFAAAGFGYPAVARVLRRHVRIKRSVCQPGPRSPCSARIAGQNPAAGSPNSEHRRQGLAGSHPQRLRA
jgi:hypothetical protein